MPKRNSKKKGSLGLLVIGGFILLGIILAYNMVTAGLKPEPTARPYEVELLTLELLVPTTPADPNNPVFQVTPGYGYSFLANSQFDIVAIGYDTNGKVFVLNGILKDGEVTNRNGVWIAHIYKSEDGNLLIRSQFELGPQPFEIKK